MASDGIDDFERNFTAFVQKVGGPLAEKAVARAGFQLLTDTIMDIPKVPLDEGTLLGSGSVFVGRKLVTTSASMATGGNPTPATQLDKAQPHTVATVGFNTPYAARMHEGTTFEFQHQGTGAEFLEQKLVEHAAEYTEIMAETMREDWLQPAVGHLDINR